MSVFLVQVENQTGLVFEQSLLSTFDRDADHPERLEAIENTAGNLAQKIGEKVQRVELSRNEVDWTWDSVIERLKHEHSNCDVAEKFLSLGHRLSAIHSLQDGDWADQFDQIVYEADEYLFSLMNNHDLIRITN